MRQAGTIEGEEGEGESKTREGAKVGNEVEEAGKKTEREGERDLEKKEARGIENPHNEGDEELAPDVGREDSVDLMKQQRGGGPVAGRDELVEVDAHGPTVDQQIEDKEWDQEEVEKRSGEIGETKESLFGPGENGVTEALLIRWTLEARSLGAELLVESGAGGLDPLERLLDPGGISEKVTSLLVGDA